MGEPVKVLVRLGESVVNVPAKLDAKARIYEVPIEYAARSREAGKKLTAADGLRVLRTLARCRLL